VLEPRTRALPKTRCHFEEKDTNLQLQHQSTMFSPEASKTDLGANGIGIAVHTVYNNPVTLSSPDERPISQTISKALIIAGLSKTFMTIMDHCGFQQHLLRNTYATSCPDKVRSRNHDSASWRSHHTCDGVKGPDPIFTKINMRPGSWSSKKQSHIQQR
jgi:hypothetical protein